MDDLNNFEITGITAYVNEEHGDFLSVSFKAVVPADIPEAAHVAEGRVRIATEHWPATLDEYQLLGKKHVANALRKMADAIEK